MRLLFAMLLLFAVSCLSLNEGTNTFVKESLNSNHVKKAVLSLRQSGATVADSYQVTITEAGNNFDTDKVGNTFTVDANHIEAILDSASINFVWLANDTLQIDYDKELNTFIKEPYVARVVVIYKAR